MPLPTAPCPKCRTLLVYGQRQCLRCGERFDYGPSAPPEPTPQQMQEALAHAQLQHAAIAAPQPAHTAPTAPPPARVASPAASPPREDLIDRGRFDEAQGVAVQPEAIPGFIDSTLFAAFTPKDVAVERLADLESTQVDGAEAQGAPAMAPKAFGLELELTSHAAAGDVTRDDIPGFIDSTLFAAFTPAHVETETPEGLEVLPTASAVRPAKRPRGGDDGLGACSDCGARHDRTVCPACGARRREGG